MGLKNSEKSFGTIAKFFHWTIVLLFIHQYASIAIVEYLLEKNSPFSSLLIGGLHKPLGFFLFFIGIAAFVWHFTNIKVKFSDTMPLWEKRFAQFVHRSLYVSLIFMAFSGIAMSVTGAKSINIFNLFSIPAFREKDKELSSFFWDCHELFAIVLIVLLGLHLGGILKQHILRKDPVIKKMLPHFKSR